LLKRKFTVGVLLAVLLLPLAFGVSAEEERVATWVDEVIIVEEPTAATAISRLQAGDIDIWADSTTDVTAFEAVQADPALDYYPSFGSYSEMTFNTVGPEFEDGRLNPFSSRRIREAMNMIVDRDYIAQEIYGGLAVPKYSLLNGSFVDYSRVVEKIRELELKYAPNLELAEEIVTEEMLNLDAELIDGIWHYKGEPIEILILARSEDERAQVGEYFASQLGQLGFKTIVDYRTGAEASPIWMMGDPWLGEWHAYTGGWISGAVYRDEGHIFNQMYTRRTMTQPRWQALDPLPELDEISDKLYRKEFSTMEERKELYERALELAFEDSPCIFIVDQMGFTPRRAEITVASDLANHVAGTRLWPSTIRRGDEVGGTITVATQQVLVEPWNPVAGSNWIFDLMPVRATMDRGIMSDPYTGNYWPDRMERAEIYVLEGLPIETTLDWVSLEFVPEIEVPQDAWIDWDPVEQRFITVGEKYPDGFPEDMDPPKRKTVTYFPADFYETARWHDGSPVSLGDILFWYILEFDRGMEESPIFDESAVPGLETMRASFRGFKIISEDPLIYESYSTSWSLDAEFMAADVFPVEHNYGKAPWHTLALGVLAEMDEQLAFSASKANLLDAEWLGFHTGPSIPILAEKLDRALEENFLPYANFLKDYISEEEIKARYGNAKQWYEDKGHFWIGDGPMYLEKAYPVEKMVHLKRNTAYSEPVTKWAMFEEARMAEVDVHGPARVTAGEEAIVNVDVTFRGEPYALEDMQEVKFIVLDAEGRVAVSGMAEGIADGKFQVVLTAEITEILPVGSNTLEVIALPKLVGGATFGQLTFVILP